MAWIKVKEQGHLATSERSADERTATRVFVAISNEPTTPAAAETADDGSLAIPVYRESHPDDEGRKVVSINAKPDEESPCTVFRVQVDYSSKSDGADEEQDDPLDRPDEVTWDFTDATEPYFIDCSDTPKPVLNSAKEPFEDFLERETGSLVATVKRNVAADGYDPGVAIQYKDVVNSGGFRLDGKSIGTGQAKLKAWTAGPVKTENDVSYRETQFVIHFRESWDDKVDDRGLREKDGSTGKVKPIMNGTPPTPVESPWPLNGSGAKKANISDTPAELVFKPYKKLSFSRFRFS